MTKLRPAVCNSTAHNILLQFERTSQPEQVVGMPMYNLRGPDTTSLYLLRCGLLATHHLHLSRCLLETDHHNLKWGCLACHA